MNDNSTDALNGPNDQKLDQILAAVQQLDARVGQVETKVDQRLRETRPIWEAIQAQVLELKESVHTQVSELKESMQAQVSELKESMQVQGSELKESVQAQVSELKESVQAQVSELKESVQAQLGELKESQQSFRTEVEKSFRLLDRRMEMYADMVARVHAYERDVEDRVDELAKRLA